MIAISSVAIFIILWQYFFMKTTLDIPDDLMREIKIRAAVEGRKMKDVVADALKAGLPATRPLRRGSKGIRVEADKETGLPTVVGIEHSPAAAMTREELKRLLQDVQQGEDLGRVEAAQPPRA
jgi:plasmid stability protein